MYPSKQWIWISVLFLMGSCDLVIPEPPERPVECYQPGEFDYLAYYEQWALAPCSTSLCSTYTRIWKELFMEQNGYYTEEMFERQITVTGGVVREGGDGTFFVIEYRVHNDWAEAFAGDVFAIRLYTGHDYPQIGLPEEEYLDAINIRKLLDHRGFDSRISKVPRTGPLKFRSREEAIRALMDESGADTLCFNRIFMSHHRGTLSLEAFARYKDAENECIKGTIDLVTGQMNFADKDCDRIFGY